MYLCDLAKKIFNPSFFSSPQNKCEVVADGKLRFTNLKLQDSYIPPFHAPIQKIFFFLVNI